MFKKVDKNSKCYEFWSLFLLIIGICVGSGIYLKNKELIEQTKNPLISVILWLVIGFICVISFVTFIEIARSTIDGGNGTTSNWSRIFISRKVASLYSIFYIFIYMPSYQAIFVAATITYFLEMVGAKLLPYQLLLIFLIIGASLYIMGVILNLKASKFSKSLQLWSLLIRYIPLIVAFFAGFILAIFSKNNWNLNSTGDATTWNMFAGFGAILFSFDGYTFAANKQKNIKNKEVVGKAIIMGLIFISIFYFLMAISLFMGGDGSIQSVLIRVISLGEPKKDSAATKVATVITLGIMTTIYLLNVNMFTHFGITSMVSDHNMKLVYMPNVKNKIKFAAIFQSTVSYLFFAALVICAVLVSNGDYQGITSKTANNSLAMTYIGQMASVAVVLQFWLLTSLIVAAMVNRFTKKIDLEKQKGFWPCSIISLIAFTIVDIFGLLVFLVPDLIKSRELKTNWVESGGLIFTMIFITSILFVVIMWLVQEEIFKIKPFKNSFEDLVDKNMKVNNWEN
ncbi:amino acid permease [Entomoplasma ellychniae]|uniref:Amino acid permease n=1 Tax=Entomoplasma ellychniae TaxID=2114 RepID=A0A8E2UA37_9MOLU|nr:APC family permease [Entomoplasma ellychniae]PPE04784.1 amino acid permease [Entomoplasma ellychniae]